VAGGPWRGDLLSLEFIPKDFRFMTEEELAAPTVIVSGTRPSRPTQEPAAGEDLDAMRRRAMMEGLRSALRQPQAGEKRELGYLDKIECTNKAIFFHMRVGTQTMKLLNASPETLPIRLFTGELEGFRFGCGIKPVEVPAVFIYADKPDTKAKSAGVIVSLDFVPKTFALN
jgi:hypothetical protein